ncbi:MAG: sulfatase [Planctomycetota bacterium]
MMRLSACVLAIVATLSFMPEVRGLEQPDGDRGTIDRPNIVWIMSEDNSKHYLKLFDDSGVETPNIRAMADKGVIFNRAFSNAPVCSVARTTLITGIYAPRLGTHFHRRIKLAEMPEGWELFPKLLRSAGYYTTNNAKKDYNCIEGEGVWDSSGRKAHWKNRGNLPDEGTPQPFFHVQTYTDSHESSLHVKQAWFDEPDLKTDPTSVQLAPYHPDTELFRATHARYHDRIQVIDQKVGKILDELKQAGELENTFVFYFGDHGGVLPRGKGYIYESGLHVPLVVRVPEKWKTRSPFSRGSQTDGFVEFIDFGPTVLNLAGLETPKQMDGAPFMGSDVTKQDVDSRASTIGYADRMDEKYDMCRSLRQGNWKYIRNFTPIYPDGLQNNYRYEMLAYQQWRRLFQKGSLNDAQSAFFRSKPTEMLFDLNSDPHEVNNLVQSPEHQERLKEMRRSLAKELAAMNDLGFFPENVLVDSVDGPFVKYGEDHSKQIETYIETANLALCFDEKVDGPFDRATATSKLLNAIASEDSTQRHWALVAAGSVNNPSKELVDAVTICAEKDDARVNRIRAAEMLGTAGIKNPVPVIKEVISKSKSSTVNLIALQALVFFKDGPFEFPIEFDVEQKIAMDSQVLRRIAYFANWSTAESKAKLKALMRAERSKK